MRILNYLLIAVLLAGCGSVDKEEPKIAEETKTAEKKTPTKYSELSTLAEKGDAEAQTSLGLMYDLGRGVPQDYQQAMKWYKLAAKQGQARAQYFLGILYGLGHGVPQDSVLAYKWVNLGAAQGVKDAPQLKNMLAKKMTASQIQEAEKLAREFKPKKERTKFKKPNSPRMQGRITKNLQTTLHGNIRSKVLHQSRCRYYNCKNCTV